VGRDFKAEDDIFLRCGLSVMWYLIAFIAGMIVEALLNIYIRGIEDEENKGGGCAA